MAEQILGIKEANASAGGIAKVSRDPIEAGKWLVEFVGPLETRKPMTLPEWKEYLSDWVLTNG